MLMSGDLGTSGCRETLLDEVAHQPLGPLLVLDQHLMGAADLVTFQAVEERDAHHGRCKEQTPGQCKERDSSLGHRDQCPGLKGRGRQWLLIDGEHEKAQGATLSCSVLILACLCSHRSPSKPQDQLGGPCTALKGKVT